MQLDMISLVGCVDKGLVFVAALNITAVLWWELVQQKEVCLDRQVGRQTDTD